jgi:hypothetical protein
MRTKLTAGLTMAVAVASIAGPAMAATVSPANPAAPNVSPANPAAPTVNPANPATPNFTPQLHLNTCKVARSSKGYTTASCQLVAINMGKQTVWVSYSANMKTFTPKGTGFAARHGRFGIPAKTKANQVYKVYTVRFAIKGQSVAQVRKHLKVTISNPTGGAVITHATATA